jgi:hypothetical protein
MALSLACALSITRVIDSIPLDQNHPSVIAGEFLLMALMIILLFARLYRAITYRCEHSYVRSAARPDGDAIYVALTYTKGLASMDTTTWAWDKGWLNLRDNSLTFDGESTSFILPYGLVRGARLVRSDGFLISKETQVLIEWNDGDAVCHITLSCWENASLEAVNQINEDITNRMIATSVAGINCEYDSCQLPYRSVCAMEAFEVNSYAATSLDTMKALSITVPIGVVSGVVVWYVLKHFSIDLSHGGHLVFVPVICGLHAGFVPGVKARIVMRRYQKKGLFTEYLPN